jgi:hypothetical protein
MKKLISSIVVAVVLSLSTVSGVEAQDQGAKADATKVAKGVRFYIVEGLEGLYVSNAEAYGAAQSAGIERIMIRVVTVKAATK